MRARISGHSRSNPVPYNSEFDPADRILLIIILLLILEGEHAHPSPYFTGGYVLGGLVSTASAAESFRSRCGSVRGAPVCSSQASSLVAPQVGQGTDNICLRVRSFVFTATGYRLPRFENCSISDTFALRRVSEFFMGPPPMWQL
jgi:hypothetical protein